ncbi:MAG: streptomycin adenylyltransferase [Ruminococcus sp.]|nr:streptomycin adenylyltransferase [Ruminococcus sp.]
MNDKFSSIKSNILAFAENNESVEAVIAIGSSTRSEMKADEFSDLDLLIATDDAESWLYGDIPHKFGEVKISFVEPTLGGGKERRILYKNALDVDMIVFTPSQLTEVVQTGVAGWVCNRGYTVMHDSMGISELLAEYVKPEIGYNPPSEAEFINIVNDFSFHTIWAYKKLIRGEMWSAKMCIDAYLKNYLLKIIEMYCNKKYNVDVWHDGRFLDKWADERIKASLRKCFSRYNKSDIKTALLETKALFDDLAKSSADLMGYQFPKKAVSYADEILSEYNKR